MIIDTIDFTQSDSSIVRASIESVHYTNNPRNADDNLGTILFHRFLEQFLFKSKLCDSRINRKGVKDTTIEGEVTFKELNTYPHTLGKTIVEEQLEYDFDRVLVYPITKRYADKYQNDIILSLYNETDRDDKGCAVVGYIYAPIIRLKRFFGGTLPDDWIEKTESIFKKELQVFSDWISNHVYTYKVVQIESGGKNVRRLTGQDEYFIGDIDACRNAMQDKLIELQAKHGFSLETN